MTKDDQDDIPPRRQVSPLPIWRAVAVLLLSLVLSFVFAWLISWSGQVASIADFVAAALVATLIAHTLALMVAGGLGWQRPASAFGAIRVALPWWLGAGILGMVLGVGVTLGLNHLIQNEVSWFMELMPPQESPFWRLADQPAGVFLAVVPLPILEELMFRGGLQGALARRMAPAAAITLTAAVFALYHLQPIQMITAFPLGLLLGWLFWRTGSLWPAIATHIGYNGTVIAGWLVLDLLPG